LLVIGHLLYWSGHEMNPTPDCPLNSYQYEVTLCDVDLVCHLDYVPAEQGSTGSWGDPLEPDFNESIELLACYVRGTDYDVKPITVDVYLKQIERLALANFKDTIP
jgi:hypothetical protein